MEEDRLDLICDTSKYVSGSIDEQCDRKNLDYNIYLKEINETIYEIQHTRLNIINNRILLVVLILLKASLKAIKELEIKRT